MNQRLEAMDVRGTPQVWEQKQEGVPQKSFKVMFMVDRPKDIFQCCGFHNGLNDGLTTATCNEALLRHPFSTNQAEIRLVA